LSDLNLGVSVVITTDNYWCGVGRLQVAMHSNYRHILVFIISLPFYIFDVPTCPRPR